jgi:hypothetical protein
MRPIAAWVVVAAFLMQSLAGAPVAMRMVATVNLAAIIAAFPLCNGGNGGDHSNPDGQAGDNHDHCLLCHSSFGAAPLPGPLFAILAVTLAAIAIAFRQAPLRSFSRIAGYTSRGPPCVA